jgi:hypothetical protein
MLKQIWPVIFIMSDSHPRRTPIGVRALVPFLPHWRKARMVVEMK